MKKNQKGFSHVETLLLLVIVGIIAGVGWYVWNANSQTNKNLDSAVNSASNSADATKKAQENEKANIYAGWKTYCDPLKVGCIKYPHDWIVEEEVDVNAQKPNVRFTTPINSKHPTTVYYTLIVSGPTYTPKDLEVEYTYDLTVPVKNLKVYQAIIKGSNAPIVMILDPQSSGDPDKGGLGWYLDASPTDLPYGSQDKAQAWFDSIESVVATQIVQSFTFQKK
jgi:type II secretory pathway pseudopilin PulG